MKEFTYYAPTEIIFGCGKATAIGEVVRRYGETALLVTCLLYTSPSPRD